MIRKAKAEDLPRINEIYACARSFMRAHGNMNQWVGGYPGQELLEGDIARGELYAMVSEDDEIYGVFMLHYGKDPTYAVIEDGAWLNDSDYATIHRIASDGTHTRVYHEAVTFARAQYSHLRVDTHADNKPMQEAITREDFVYCGIIHLENGDPRLAYEWVAPASGAC
ncbi:MAG: N-acetyltransferase [Clostridia bacterium]|nr:N-acetyltransferase [Clostridia bacterium]